MSLTLQQILKNLRNNEQYALPQLLALLGTGIKQHELQSRQFAKQLLEQEYQPKTPLPKLSPGKRLALPDSNFSVTKSTQQKTVYLHKEFAALDNLLAAELSDVIFSDEELREGQDITQEDLGFDIEPIDLSNHVENHDFVPRQGQDILDEQIQRLQISDENLTLSGFKKSKKPSSFKLQYDTETTTELTYKVEKFTQIQLIQNTKTQLSSKLDQYIQDILPLEEENYTIPEQIPPPMLFSNDFQQEDTPEFNELNFSENLAATAPLQAGETLQFSELPGCKTSLFMDFLTKFGQNALEIKQIQNGDLYIIGK